MHVYVCRHADVCMCMCVGMHACTYVCVCRHAGMQACMHDLCGVF